MLWGGAALLLGLVGTSLFLETRARHRIHTVKDAPAAPVAVVFGAGLAHEAPSPLLAERLDTAIALYRAQRVQRLLLSGHVVPYHNEPSAMRRYVRAAGIPEDAVLEDGEGRSTFESCLRARQMLVGTPVLLVTQRFHLARALYLADALGLSAEGVAADGDRPRRAPYPWRELLARPLAVARVFLHRASERLPERVAFD
jgi:SanA protein